MSHRLRNQIEFLSRLFERFDRLVLLNRTHGQIFQVLFFLFRREYELWLWLGWRGLFSFGSSRLGLISSLIRFFNMSEPITMTPSSFSHCCRLCWRVLAVVLNMSNTLIRVGSLSFNSSTQLKITLTGQTTSSTCVVIHCVIANNQIESKFRKQV